MKTNEVASIRVDERSTVQPPQEAIRNAAENQPSLLPRLFDELSSSANKNIADMLNKICTKRPYERDNYVAQQLGLTYNTMYYIMGYKRSFPLDRLGAFCEKFAKVSCNEIALGVKRPVILPKVIQRLVTNAMQLNSISGSLDSLIERYKRDVQQIQTTPARASLCADRLKELADDLQLPPKRAQSVVWGKDNNVSLMFSGPQKISLIRRVEEQNISHVKMTSALMLTFLLNVPLDYLICEDYTRTCDIAYCDENGNEMLITDKKLIRLVSIYLSLPMEKQEQMFADVILRNTLIKSMVASIASL